MQQDVSTAPWLVDPNSPDEFDKILGWWVDTLEIGS
jgi:hypothetical protein